MRILIVEDSRSLRQSLHLALRKAGYAVDTAEEGETGLWLAESNPYDLLILDLMLPKLDGLSILLCLRQQGQETPVLILTALDAVDDRVRGLRTGADDYLTKPFALDELLARVEALLRRRREARSPQPRIGTLTLNTTRRTVEREGQPLDLKPREYALMEYLASRLGDVVTRTEIENHLYDENAEILSNTIDSAICTLRKKLQSPGQKVFIRTRKGVGYQLEVES